MSDAPEEPVTEYEIERDVFPAELLARERWFVWALDDDRKIPRAPWQNPSYIDKYVSWKDEDVWTDFDTADEWVEKVDRFGHASCIPAFEDNSVERLLFFDFDDCRDPDSGAIHPWAWGLIDGQGLSAYLSTSGTGVHGFGWGSLPEGYKPSFEVDLPAWEYDDDPHMEVYAASRFVALTGEHIAGTPVSVPDLGDDAHALFKEFGTERTTGTEREPDVSRAEIADVETTTDVEDIYDAIAHVRPSDISLRSPVTEEYSGRDANCARDPTWANSKSGTRLAEFDDHWLYRAGNHRLDALQVVALEESIIRSETDYPSSDEFVDAVEALRDRGAHIPELETVRESPALDIVEEDDGDGRDAAEAAAVAGGPDADTDSGGEETAETDGGTATADVSADVGPSSFEDRVRDAIIAADNDDIQQKTARHRIAKAFTDEFDFVYPEDNVRAWRSTLYVYNPDEGVYEPRGEYFVERELEKAAGDYVTNQVANEVVGKLERMTIARGPQFATEPHRLVVANGILNLHTGELDAWTPTEYHRTKLDVRWNPDAGQPEAIDDFLHDVVEPGDVPTLYRLIAHTLYKEYVGEKAAMLVGGGQNGKSVFLDFVEQFIGKHNVSHRALQDFEDKFAANSLQGKMANIHPDMGDKAVMDMNMFKKLTGRDTMEADVKFESSIEFENYATLMFAANEMPVFGEDNHAIWRRWVYVNFPYTFDETDPEAKDPEPKRVLMRRLTHDEELEALLVRCQQEIQKWWEGREWYPDAMDPVEVREQMKKAAEPVYDFAMTCLAESAEDDAYLPKGEVRTAYREYATQEGLPKMGKEQFGERLVNIADLSIERGRRTKGNIGYTYEGVEWTERGRQILGLDEPAADDDQSTVDDVEQSTRIVLDTLRDLVAANDNQPVSEDMVIGASMGKVGKVTAENALDQLIQQGDVLEDSDGLIDT